MVVNLYGDVVLSIHLLLFSGFVEPGKIEAYVENRSKYIAKGKGTAFSDAVKQMEEYIADPVVIHTEIISSNSRYQFFFKYSLEKQT